MDENLSQLLQNLMNSDQIPDNLKDLIHNLPQDSTNRTDYSSNSSQEANMPELDINMILKLKSIIDEMNHSQNDPRSNLLVSLKPYLKPSRKEKIDQYIGLLRMTKVVDVINQTNGEKSHE